MNIQLLKSQDTQVLEEYLAPHKAECMFICSNLKAAGIDYKGGDFEGEYFGYLDKQYGHLEKLLGVIVHYGNGNVMMHAKDHDILEKLILHLKKNISRPIAGILGPNNQVEHVINNLGVAHASFSLNSNEKLYAMKMVDINEPYLMHELTVVTAKDVSYDELIQWMIGYEMEALGALDNDDLFDRAKAKVDRIIQGSSFILVKGKQPVSLVGINARLADMVQVGPVWTPPEYRNQGFARLLLSYTLHQEKLKGTKQALLFTDNPAAIKAYLAVGFQHIGYYRLALLEKPIKLQEIEFTKSPIATDIDCLTHKINQETLDFGSAHPFAFFVRDEHNQIIAGCNGSVIFGSIYTDQLWVHPAHRKNGLGHQLMEAVHDYGRRSGCSMATVATMSFQGAKTFYEKLGYVVDFERTGYTHSSSCIFLKQSL